MFELVVASRRCITTTTRVRTGRRGSSAQTQSATGSQHSGQRGVRRLRIGRAGGESAEAGVGKKLAVAHLRISVTRSPTTEARPLANLLGSSSTATATAPSPKVASGASIGWSQAEQVTQRAFGQIVPGRGELLRGGRAARREVAGDSHAHGQAFSRARPRRGPDRRGRRRGARALRGRARPRKDRARAR